MNPIRISRYKREVFAGTYSDKKASSFGIAILLHIGLLLLIIFLQQHVPIHKKLPPSFQVDLVSYSPTLEDLLKPEKKQPKKILTKKPDKRLKKKPIKKAIKKIVKPVKEKEKVFSEKKALKPAKTTKAVEEDIKEKVEDLEQNKIRDLLSEIREKVAEQEMQTDDDYEEEEVQTSGKRIWSKGGHTASAIYHGVLAATIQQNWVFNERLAKLSKLGKNDKELKVRVVIKIMRNGDLGDIWTETKSGNSFLDKSAIRAIKKAAPFPPLPKEFQRSSYEIGLIFSPKGLK